MLKRAGAIAATDLGKSSRVEVGKYLDWLAGFRAIMVLYILAYLPSLILTFWVLNGQHKEASSSRYEREMLADVAAGSPHMVSPWVDSLFLGHAPQDDLSALPAMGLLLPAA